MHSAMKEGPSISQMSSDVQGADSKLTVYWDGERGALVKTRGRASHSEKGGGQPGQVL